MTMSYHRRLGVQAIFLKGAEPSLPEIYSDSARKTAVLTCKITLLDSLDPIIISKNPECWALHLTRVDVENFIFFV